MALQEFGPRRELFLGLNSCADKKGEQMRKAISALMVGGAVAAGAVTFASPGWATTTTPSDVEAAACVLTKSNVTSSSSTMKATGGRSGCSGSAFITVQLAEDVSFAPDPILAKTSKTIVNGSLSATAGCGGRGHGQFYTWVISSTGNSTESGRTGHC